MKKLIISLVLIAIAVTSGCVSQQLTIDEEETTTIITTTVPPTTTTPSLEMKCINSGGTVSTEMCCNSVGDFPNTCLVGACGCSLEYSHEVKTCDCGEGKCFDGDTCTLLEY